VYIAQVGNDTESLFFYNAIVKGEYSELTQKVLKEKNYWPDDIDFEELKIISEKMDFLGVNFYGTQAVKYKAGEGRFDYEITSTNKENVAYNNFACEEDLYKLMIKIKEDTDGKLPILITENGTGNDVTLLSEKEIFVDDSRIDYIKENLVGLIKAIDNGVNVIGYMYWSVFDNFEWNWGYDYTLGLVHIDYQNNYKRTKKKSYEWYKNFISKQRELTGC
jgi:beta-glucosidase